MSKSHCSPPKSWVKGTEKHKGYCRSHSKPKTGEMCDKRKMVWIKGSDTRKAYCRSKAKPRKLSKDKCDSMESKKWVTGSEKRKGYCRNRRSVRK